MRSMSRCRRWSVRQAFVIRAASTGSKAPRDALPQFSSRRASGAEARSRLMARPPRRRRALVQAPGNAPDSPETVQCPPHATPPGGRPAVWPGEMFPPACGGKSLSATAPFSLRPAGGAGSCAHHSWPSPRKDAGLALPVHWGIQAAVESDFQTRLIDGKLPSEQAERHTGEAKHISY